MASFTAGVRRYIEECSSDSDVFGGKEDLFYSVLGKGKGLWGIRRSRGLETDLETDKKVEINVRLTQSEFRNKMLKQFEKKVCNYRDRYTIFIGGKSYKAME